MTFEEKVRADVTRLNGFFGDELVELRSDKTSKGQQFLTVITCTKTTVITCKKWYIVRLYLEEDHRNLSDVYACVLPKNDRFLCQTQHKTSNDAMEKVKEYHQQLKAGDYKNFFNNYDPLGINTWFFNNSVKFDRITVTKTVPANCVLNPDAYLKRGDIIQRDLYKGANHDGIYIGNGKVIHISGDTTTTTVACEGELFGDFVKNPNDAIRVLVPRVRFRTPEEIAKQAEAYRDAKFGDGLYNVFMKNCQHFAFLCAFDIEYSEDVAKFLIGSSSIVLCSLIIGFKLKQIISK